MGGRLHRRKYIVFTYFSPSFLTWPRWLPALAQPLGLIVSAYDTQHTSTPQIGDFEEEGCKQAARATLSLLLAYKTPWLLVRTGTVV